MKKESWSEFLLPIALIFGLVLLLSFNIETSTHLPAESNSSETLLKSIVGYLAVISELAAATVIGGAVFRAIWDYLRQLFARRQQHFDVTESVRLQLGRVLTLGLEFTVASDILRTVVAPNRQDILNLGAIVLLRTLLNYFLEREIQQGEKNRSIDS